MKQLLIALMTVSILSCGSNTSNNETSDASSDQETIGNSCLSELVEKNEIEKMISKEQVASIVGISADKIKFEENKSSSAKYSTVRFEWEPEQERTVTMEMKVGDRTVSQTLPLQNGINVGNIDLIGDKKEQSALEYFNSTYGPKTKEEKEQAMERIDRAQENSDQVNEKSVAVIKSMADKLTSSRVDGIGGSAFGSINNAKGMIYYNLKVLHGDTMFEITTDVSEDSNEDIRITKAIAQNIIDNCN